MLLKLLTLFMPKRKDGKCHWWQHSYDVGEFQEWLMDSGSYIEGKPIQYKVGHMVYTCKKCGNTRESDVIRMH